MKAITYQDVRAFNQKGDMVHIPCGSEVHFDPDETGLYQEMTYMGETCHMVCPWPAMAIETETVDDISLAVDIQKEMEAHRKVLIVSRFSSEVQTCYYVYPREELQNIGWNSRRKLFPQIVEMLSPDSDVTCYIAVEDDLDNSLFKFFRKEKNKNVQLCELESVDEVLDYFNNI